MPHLLDLFCKAGGAGMGYRRAGFEVVGVDIEPQKNYPFKFVQANALEALEDCEFVRAFDAIHASPPCQFATAGARRWGTQDNHANLIPATRAGLQASGLPYVIENVASARAHLVNPIMLCGQQFDLGVFRHRLFESNFEVEAPRHEVHNGRIGDGKYQTVAGNPGGYSKRDGVQFGDTAAWSKAMGIDWMTAKELAQAIPPAYTEYIGRALFAHLRG